MDVIHCIEVQYEVYSVCTWAIGCQCKSILWISFMSEVGLIWMNFYYITFILRLMEDLQLVCCKKHMHAKMCRWYTQLSTDRETTTKTSLWRPAEGWCTLNVWLFWKLNCAVVGDVSYSCVPEELRGRLWLRNMYPWATTRNTTFL